ncbi:MAG: hypothetical protein R2911_16335 [Caldilineaceae bacterium]
MLVAFSVPWWNVSVQANDAPRAQSAGGIKLFNGPAAQISPLSPLASPLETDTPEPTLPPTAEPAPVAATPTLPTITDSPAAMLTSGPLYSGVAANQVSPALVGTLIVALLGVGAIVFTRQR